MKIEIVDSPAGLAARTAEVMAEQIRGFVARQGRCLLALSGGTEPWVAFRELARLDVPWESVHILQVDERAAPAGHPDRNWTHIEENLLARVPVQRAQVHPMPVEDDPLEQGAARYARMLGGLAGSPPVLDLVHLGIGRDGHTASLLPEDPVLEAADRDVAITAPYQGWRRMTLTLPAINRARTILWLVAGDGKARVLEQLLAADERIPASRVRRDNALLLTDPRTAGGQHVTDS